MNSISRFIPRGTILICPKCRLAQAIITVDIYPDQTWDWRAIEPLSNDGIRGISDCCDVRYVTLEGLFFTEQGPI